MDSGRLVYMNGEYVSVDTGNYFYRRKFGCI
jgi:hypothetical protein